VSCVSAVTFASLDFSAFGAVSCSAVSTSPVSVLDQSSFNSTSTEGPEVSISTVLLSSGIVSPMVYI